MRSVQMRQEGAPHYRGRWDSAGSRDLVSSAREPITDFFSHSRDRDTTKQLNSKVHRDEVKNSARTVGGFKD